MNVPMINDHYHSNVQMCNQKVVYDLPPPHNQVD